MTHKLQNVEGGGAMKKPLVDITTINAVQSIFRGNVRDPWARELAGELADLIIYGDTVRYSLPVPESVSDGIDPFREPSLLHDLVRRDKESFYPEEYSTKEPRLLKEDYLMACFEKFVCWAKINHFTLKQWIDLHNEPWIRPVQGPRAQHRYIFLLDALRKHSEVSELVNLLHVTPDDIYYAFDIVLRYPLYGQIAGRSEQYLNHPIRDAFPLPTMQWDVIKTRPIAVSFKKEISKLAPKLTQDEYTVLLHELRGKVRQLGVHKVGPHEIDKEVIREIAAAVSLPPRLKAMAKASGVVGGIIAGAGLFPVLGPASTGIGALVSISSTIWSGNLPRRVARWEWLRWAIEWDIEQEAEDRE